MTRYATNIEHDGGCPDCDSYELKIDRMNAKMADLEAQLSSKSQELQDANGIIAASGRNIFDHKQEIESLRKQLDYKTEENKQNILAINDLRKRCEDLEADMKENMMIAFTAGHCMVPGDVSFEEWYKDFLKTKRIASKKGVDLEEAATKLGEIVDCYSRMDYDDQDIINDIAPRIFAIIQTELKKIEK